MRAAIVPTAKCPHCHKPLFTSENPKYVYQCLDCDEDFFEIEARYDSTADRDAAIESLWALIEDEPFDGETEEFENPFYGIADGDSEKLNRDDVWHWFDDRHSMGVHYLLYGYE